jgi:L-seryl-tRNA(Ser) seleniumtransferase
MVGFTEETDRAALAGLGKKYGIPVMDDLGSGCLIDLKAFGLKHEPTVQEALAAGIDVVTFSGDKLLGGPQAGLILGRKNLIEMISRNPLNRALRIDKLTLAALEATLVRYLGVEDIGTGFRTMRALVDPVTEIRKRVHILMKMLKKLPPEKWQIELKDGFSMAGGGSLPDQGIPTMLLAIRCAGLNPNMLEERLRKLDIPIIARIAGEEILFDLRTIAEEEFPLIRDGLEQIHCGD